MASLSMLRKLGIYIDENFLSERECSDLCSQMESANKTENGLWSNKKATQYSDSMKRQSQSCHISRTAQTSIDKKVFLVKTLVEEAFGEKYSTKLEQPKFIRYQTGNFFAPHTDNQLNRKINITIYLNSEVSDSCTEGYCGGKLTLYNLIKSEGWGGRGVSVPSKAGMLVAYPADVLHEVTPITRGLRYAIISRFLSHEALYE